MKKYVNPNNKCPICGNHKLIFANLVYKQSETSFIQDAWIENKIRIPSQTIGLDIHGHLAALVCSKCGHVTLISSYPNEKRIMEKDLENDKKKLQKAIKEVKSLESQLEKIEDQDRKKEQKREIMRLRCLIEKLSHQIKKLERERVVLGGVEWK